MNIDMANTSKHTKNGYADTGHRLEFQVYVCSFALRASAWNLMKRFRLILRSYLDLYPADAGMTTTTHLSEKEPRVESLVMFPIDGSL